MPKGSDWVKLVNACRDFVCGNPESNVLAAYSEDEFSQFLFTYRPAYDYQTNREGRDYRTAVFRLLLKWGSEGGQVAVARLASAMARHRNGRPDAAALAVLAAPFLAEVGEAAAALDDPANASTPPGESASLPAELSALIQVLSDDRSGGADVAVRELRRKLREKSYANCDMPRRFHLSVDHGERLAAVLALETLPDSAYLRWLAERILVEPPFATLLAAQALTAAALCLERKDLEVIIRLAALVMERLNSMSEPANVPPRYNFRARSDEVGTARRLAELRKNKTGQYCPRWISTASWSP
jgi:hypothetical protein